MRNFYRNNETSVLWLNVDIFAVSLQRTRYFYSGQKKTNRKTFASVMARIHCACAEPLEIKCASLRLL